MPPFLSSFRSRTNFLLDTITGVIPDAPPNGTFKDRSLTCRRCGNRFRDTLELSSHFNLFPHHSDYKDSHDFDSFVRPKVSCTKVTQCSPQASSAGATSIHASLPELSSFSEAQAYYAPPEKDKESRPAILRKFPTLSSLSISAAGEQSQPVRPTDYADNDVGPSRNLKDPKGKQRAMPHARRHESFQYGQPLASSDEEAEHKAPGPSAGPLFTSPRYRARSNVTQVLTSGPEFQTRPRSSTSSIADISKMRREQAPPLPPKIPRFDWQEERAESPPSSQTSSEDTASIASERSFRTVGSVEILSELSMFRAYYAQEKGFDKALLPSSSSASFVKQDANLDQQRSEKQAPQPSTRHTSDSNLLLEGIESSYDDVPPSYHELHGDTDAFDDLARHTSQHLSSRWDGFATVLASPVSRVILGSRRPRRSTNASPFTSSTRFPVTFSGFDDIENVDARSALRNNQLYDPSSEMKQAQKDDSGRATTSQSTNAPLPPLASSSSFSSLPSPSTPKTPFELLTNAPFASPPLSLLRPQQPFKSSAGAGRRSRHTVRAKSDSAPSTRCPTCFTKFASLNKTLEHLDNSDCGAVEFESGIM